jgi:hypothetical protein
MFGPLTPADMVSAIGRATRDAARSDEPASDFSRGQLMSAYSVTRHLGVELTAFGPELRAFADAVAAQLRTGAGLACGTELAERADALDQTDAEHRIGDLVTEALDALRADPDPAAAALRARIHAALRGLADREVELLAEVIEGPAS